MEEILRKIIGVLATYDLIHSEKTRVMGKKRVVLRGLCEPENETIWIFDKHCGSYADKVDTIVHELLHAVYPEERERAIEKRTDELIKNLWGGERPQ